jgi:hypothetical protein
MATTSATESTVEMSLFERITKLEEGLKDLKRAARQELKARRRRRGARVNANGEKASKGETPEQLKAWHEEVRKVWDEMRKSDPKTPYKRAVAEASARRKGSSAPSTTAAAAPVVASTTEKKSKKTAAPVAAAEPVQTTKKVKKSSTTTA